MDFRGVDQVLGRLRNKISVIDCTATGGLCYVAHVYVLKRHTVGKLSGVEKTTSIDRIHGDAACFEFIKVRT